MRFHSDVHSGRAQITHPSIDSAGYSGNYTYGYLLLSTLHSWPQELERRSGQEIGGPVGVHASGRLKRRQLKHDPTKVKWVQSTPVMEIGEAWQQWIRLVNSYEDGLYLAYDNKDLAFNNNGTESIIHKLKYQFKKWLGRGDIQSTFEVHADNYAKLLDFDFTTEKISEVLSTSEIAVVNEERQLLHALYASTRRMWRIRESDTRTSIYLNTTFTP